MESMTGLLSMLLHMCLAKFKGTGLCMFMCRRITDRHCRATDLLS